MTNTSSAAPAPGSEPSGGVFLTGFPGFIAGRLVENLWAHDAGGGRYFFLVEERFAFAAKRKCEALCERFPAMQGRWQIVVGDIVRPDLGIDASAMDVLRREVTRVWHLAAVYDLAVPLAFAWKVNVDGTRHVLDFCEMLVGIDALYYVSTCYVAGAQTGLVREADLDRGQRFNNHYEATKFRAEQEVVRRQGSIPTVILRPSIVVGDSRTGEIAKVDGPYHVLALLTRLPAWIPVPNMGSGVSHINVVPVDYVVAAMGALSRDPRAVGRTFHLADPTPPTTGEVLGAMAAALRRTAPRGRVPMAAVKGLSRFGAMRRATRIPPQLLPYIESGPDLDVGNAAELLARTSIRCPRFTEYAPTLVRWATANPKVLHGGAR